MGVFTFVCRKSGGEWEAKQHKGELEGSAASTYDLERQLVSAAYAKDPCGGVQSSFTMVSPDSAVCQVRNSLPRLLSCAASY
jgi:large subunit ribosomal protein LP1